MYSEKYSSVLQVHSERPEYRKCENTENCELNLQAITAVACEGLFDCSGVFTWPNDTPPDGIGTDAIENPLTVEDDTKQKCDGSVDIIAIPGQFEADPYK